MFLSLAKKARTHAAVYSDEQSFAVELLVCLVDDFRSNGEKGDDDPFTWQAESIRMEIEEKYQTKVPPENIDKLMAAISVLTSDEFEQKAATFIQFCNVFAGSPVNPDVFDKASVAECAWGYLEARMIDPSLKLSDEVKGYIKLAMRDECLTMVPASLKDAASDTSGFLNEYADDPETFQAAWKSKEDRTREIDESISENMQELVDNLTRLSLKNGSTSFLSTGDTHVARPPNR